MNRCNLNSPIWLWLAVFLALVLASAVAGQHDGHWTQPPQSSHPPSQRWSNPHLTSAWQWWHTQQEQPYYQNYGRFYGNWARQPATLRPVHAPIATPHYPSPTTPYGVRSWYYYQARPSYYDIHPDYDYLIDPETRALLDGNTW